jgi:hypothetical protein
VIPVLSDLSNAIKDVKVVVASLLAIPAGSFAVLDYFNLSASGGEVGMIWYYGGASAVFAMVSVMF